MIPRDVASDGAALKVELSDCSIDLSIQASSTKSSSERIAAFKSSFLDEVVDFGFCHPYPHSKET